ncbi:MAG: aspartate kinase [Acidobacteria bacterium]|nr:aspartate kinase [Acidobacteriota bacterium]
MLIVMKFGGTSVGSAARIREAALLALRSAAAGHRVVVVTSAMSGVTNQLIAAAESAARGHWEPAVREAIYRKHEEVAAEVIGDPKRRAEALGQIARRLDQLEKLCFGLSMVHELTPRLLDAISGIGECLSAPLLAGAIASAGQSAVSIEASELIVTNDQFGSAEPIMGLTREKAQAALVPLLDAGIIPVVTGFIAATGDGVTTTLGRGGSDYSASILGAVLDADEIWIWTDVNGVMSANPAEVPEARTLREISYSEAAEMAFYGAKVLHYKTILPACEKHIPVLILNSFNPADPGTRVTVDGRPSSRGVKAVTSFRNVSMITISGRGMQGIPGIAARAFGVVASERASAIPVPSPGSGM